MTTSDLIGVTETAGLDDPGPFLNESSPKQSIMHESLAQFHYYTEGVVLTPISVFGVIGK